MITEDYVSFEIAKLLKEKGFDESTSMVYMSYDHLCKLDRYDSIRNSNYNDITKNYFEYTAPTLQMAMAWLREHKMYIMIDRSWSVKNSWQYCICVNDNFDHLIKQESIPNRTYEEAVEAAIRYCLENLI